MTQTTQPTDTEMLDWIIENDASLDLDYGGWQVSHHGTGGYNLSDYFPTPRQAIAAAMEMEKQQ